MAYTVGELVAEFLPAVGVDTAFGIVSVHNIPMLDALSQRNAVRYVMARGEMGGAHMADAYARVSGHLGVVFTSTGPGAANAMPGLVEARFAGSPVLHVTGQTATRFLGRDMGTVHDVPGQTEMLASVCKRAFRVRAPQEALATLMVAATAALTPPMGPVSVEVPIDIQRMEVPRPDWSAVALSLPPAPPPEPLALAAAVAALRQAKRPMLWLGNGAKGAREAALRLLDLGFGAVSSWNGRGIVAEDDPRTLGGLHGAGSPPVAEFYAGCDAMLVVGSRLRGHETMEFSLKLPRPLIHVDIDPAANGRTYQPDIFVQGDAALTMHAIADALEAKPSDLQRDLAALKPRAVAEYARGLGPYESFPATLRAAMPRDALWVRDITISNSAWGNRIMPVLGPRDAVHPVGAAIGPGLPLGIGAALAGKGRKAIAMVGDGGFALNLPELWTAVQEQAELVIMVMNDKGYGVIRHIQDHAAGRRFFHDLQGPDLMQLAALAGLPGMRVSSVEEFGPTLERAFATKGPVLLEVDMATIGEHPPYAPYNQPRKAG
ncbi:thiamine pyrophosphate-binding protein [Sabulicella glaciei]|uniref:Thiamine pyrophosphate-binding protein n=1 Tax=Sabulicella glaciei TaxID=2984948 RepID=A0ABT3NQ02_9PROT|nr:thiamine pyrophosphate-binding protein [Roseococcus sp. MDT2-1-1]MCW8084245.1 thiamine pyrophosphate-binding protein [Roseococcus sp. MDT2-1-1]